MHNGFVSTTRLRFFVYFVVCYLFTTFRHGRLTKDRVMFSGSNAQRFVLFTKTPIESYGQIWKCMIMSVYEVNFVFITNLGWLFLIKCHLLIAR